MLISLLLLSLAAQVLGVFHRSINWDEFIFLDNIYRVANGRPVGLLQTPYAHLFGWLTHVGNDEIQQIALGRLLFVFIWAGSLVLLYRLAKQLMDPLGALASVVLVALFAYSIWNAASFRIDALLLPVVLSIVLLLLDPTVSRVAAAGVLSGIAVALTMKAVLWAPTFMGMLAVGLWNKKDKLKPVVAGALSGVTSFASIMMAHRLTAAATPGIFDGYLAKTGSYMFVELGPFPRSDVFALAVLLNPVTWMLMVIGLGLAATDLCSSPARRKGLLLILLALPVFSIAFYANAFPYAYVVLMPTGCLLAGRAFSRFFGRDGNLRGIAALVSLAAAALPLAYGLWSFRIDQQQPQKQILARVHDLFKEPVPYIDRGGMVSSFPRPIGYLTKWGVRSYREAGIPGLTHYIHSAHPPLLIVNKPLLDVWQGGEAEKLDEHLRLLREDVDTIRGTYAHYWGRIYLAGREWRDLAAGGTRAFVIIIPGDYTLIAEHDVTVDAHRYGPGATLSLNAGRHELRTAAVQSDLRLLWGTDTRLPKEEPVSVPDGYWE